VLYKAVQKCLEDGAAHTQQAFIASLSKAGATALLIGGLTVFVRIIHLTRRFCWRVWASIIFLLSLAGYSYFAFYLPDTTLAVSRAGFPATQGEWIFALTATVAIAILTVILSNLFPRYSVRFLIALGSVVTAGIVIERIRPKEDPTLWPVLLAGAAFAYLWYLGVLIFDLAFIWHRYIRNSVATEHLHEVWKSRTASGRHGSPPPDRTSLRVAPDIPTQS